MKYMGSKARLAKDLIPVILSGRKGGQLYVEPFSGGCNMIDKITGPRVANDSNEYLIAMWKALVYSNWIPRIDYTKEEYLYIRNNPNENKALTGWVGINCSYSGKWFGGYAGITKTKQGVRNYQEEAHRNTMSQVKLLSGVKFISGSYLDLSIEKESIIYCDPPYKGTTKYIDSFDHERFYTWCIDLKNKGHSIYISEYDMPDKFECVWEKGVKSSLSANGKFGSSKNSVERLFVVK